MRFYLAILIGKIANLLVKILDRNRGTKYAGEIALKIDPNLLTKFKDVDFNKVLFISGTNGKSTTTNLLYHVLKSNGKKVIANLEGANMLTGLATILVNNSSLGGRVRADYIIVETDERYFYKMREVFPGKNFLLMNLQKDQAQRNGEPGFVMDKIMRGVNLSPKLNLFLNNDEPRSKSLEDYGEEIIYFGVKAHGRSISKDENALSIPCPKCHHKIIFESQNNENIGKFRCSNCELKSEENADFQVNNADFENNIFEINGTNFSLPYAPPYMLYTVSAVISAANKIAGITTKDCIKSFETFENIPGRFEVLNYKGKTINYMRFKQENPETLQTFINEAANDGNRKMIALGLDPIVDEIPNFLETFYAFDCDFSKLIKTDIEKILCFSKTVCYDTANRFIYDGADPALIEILDSDNAAKILEVIDSVETEVIYLGTWLHTYETIKSYIEKEGLYA